MTLLGHKAQNHPQQTVKRGPLDDVDDRRTPPDLMAECMALAGVAAFDLDAAASLENAKAPEFYHLPCHDGLVESWFGRVWCNPPYSDCGAWVRKANDEADRTDVIAMLLPANRTEQSWWQNEIEPYRDHRSEHAIRTHFLRGRRRFDRPGWTAPAKGDRPPFGLVLVVWGAS